MIFEKIQAVKPRTFCSISCFLAMNHKAFCFNAFSENTYIIWDDNKEGLIIDPGCSNTMEENELYAFLQDEKITLRHHLLTHAHIDHVLGCNFIFTKFGLNPRFYELDRTLYEFAPGIAIKYGLPALQLPESGPTIRLDEMITLGSLQFEVLFTPGHSPGSVCFYNAQYHRIFSGDVLFEGSIGRTDLPGGNHQQLLDSIQQKLFTLPPQTEVYSGHGGVTTIGMEKMTNPFF